MDWNSIFLVLDDIFYPLIILLFLVGLFALFLGIYQLRKGSSNEQHLAWYNFPTLLNGIGTIGFALFFYLFVTGMHMSNNILRACIDIAALVAGAIFIYCLLRSRRYAALLPPKQQKRQYKRPKE